jgi:glycosyltransferase involved in cell wall biosynthesis
MIHQAFVIPSYNPGHRLLEVVNELTALLEQAHLTVPIVVVDDGSTDGSAQSIASLGVTLIKHERNRGKGAALKTALLWAQEHGIEQLVSLDADGQHPPAEAIRLLRVDAPRDALVLAVRDMAGAGAPKANQWSNRFSNRVLSLFGGRTLLDTQCGLRRYPVAATSQLAAPDDGYSFESDLVLRAARTGLPIVHIPSRVIYPPAEQRLSHFDSVRDPAKMVMRVVTTALTVRRRPAR